MASAWSSHSFAESYSCENYVHSKEQKVNPWAQPNLKGTPNKAEVVGYYSRGCFEGGTALELSGPGHEVACPQRNRFWGHPDTIKSVKNWGRWSVNAGYGKLVVRDISQPLGGPIVGHGSHQVGRDVDITFKTWKKNRPMTNQERKNLKVTKMATNTSNPWKKKGVSQFYPEKWKESYGEIVKKITTSPETARIFISPPIKKALCRQFAISKGGKTLTAEQRKNLTGYIDSKEKQKDLFTFPKWLRRIQPMTGHDGHFHVRLKCPKGSSSCKDQTSMHNSSYDDKTDASGVGCSGFKLNWWTETDPDKAGRLKAGIQKLEDAKKNKKPREPHPDDNLPWWEKKQKKKRFPQRCRDLIQKTTHPPGDDLNIEEVDTSL